MEETKNVLLEEEKLYKALEYYRINKDIELIEERIKDLELKDSNSNKFNKVIHNIINHNNNYIICLILKKLVYSMYNGEYE